MSTQLPNGLWSDFQPFEDARLKANANFHQLDWTQWKCITAQIANVGLLPGSPSVGDAYLVGAAAVHIWYNAQWNVFTPPCGWIFYDQTLNEFFFNVSGVTTNLALIIGSVYNYMVGPGVSAINNIPIFDNITGNLAADSGVTIDPGTQNVTGINDLDVANDMTVGNDASITGNVTISGAGTHSVTPEFSNEVWEKTARASSAAPGLRGIAISAESGLVTVAITTPQDIGVTSTLVTTGRPIFVGLTCDASEGYFRASPDTSVTDYFPFSVTVELYRDATLIYQSRHSITAATSGTGGAAFPFDIPPSAFWALDTPTAGTYVYTCRFAPSAGTLTNEASCDNIKIIAYEL